MAVLPFINHFILFQSVPDVAGMSNGYRRPRTSADFYDFCTMVLQYANYEGWRKDVSFYLFYDTNLLFFKLCLLKARKIFRF